MRYFFAIVFLAMALPTLADGLISAATGYDRALWTPKVQAETPAQSPISNVGVYRRPVRKASSDLQPKFDAPTPDPAPEIAPHRDPEPSAARPHATVHFSPDGGCEPEIVERIGDAERDVRVFAYAFTSEPIASALIAAKGRGCDVRVILDHVQARGTGSQLPRLVAAGIPTLVDARHPIFHDKIVVVDGETVLTGSYNFSAQASRNAENLVTLHDSSVGSAYLANWDLHAEHATAERPVAFAPTFTPGVVRPPVAEPVDEWRPFTANPGYEVYGHEDETGTFRYTQTRLKVGVAHQGVPTTYAAPTYQGFSAGSSCAGGSCGQAQSFGFFGGRW